MPITPDKTTDMACLNSRASFVFLATSRAASNNSADRSGLLPMWHPSFGNRPYHSLILIASWYESTFPRAFGEFAKRGLCDNVQEALVERSLKSELIGHISRDSTAIEGREKPAKKLSKTSPYKERTSSQGRTTGAQRRKTFEATSSSIGAGGVERVTGSLRCGSEEEFQGIQS